jgi:hypothetical protein
MFVLGCTAPELAPSGIEFVRDGVIVDGGIGADGELLNDGRELLSRDWHVGESMEIRGRNGRAVGTAPDSPRCAVLWQIEVGTSSEVELAFSFDDSILKITEVDAPTRILDGWRGVPITGKTPSWNSNRAGLPPACLGSAPVVQAIASGDQYRFAAVEGPVSDGAGDRYRVTMYR